MFSLSIISPDGFPVAMGIYPTMELAIASLRLSGSVNHEKIGKVYSQGWFLLNRVSPWVQWSIVEIAGMGTVAHSIFLE